MKSLKTSKTRISTASINFDFFIFGFNFPRLKMLNQKYTYISNPKFIALNELIVKICKINHLYETPPKK